jgi:hypothetical protein
MTFYINLTFFKHFFPDSKYSHTILTVFINKFSCSCIKQIIFGIKFFNSNFWSLLHVFRIWFLSGCRMVCFEPFENWTNLSGFEWLAETVLYIKKYFLLYKTVQARPNHSKSGLLVRFSIQNGSQSHLKTGFKKCPKNDHLNTRWSGFRMLTVHFTVS